MTTGWSRDSIKGGGKKSTRGVDSSIVLESPGSKAGTLTLALGFVSSRRGSSNGSIDYS